MKNGLVKVGSLVLVLTMLLCGCGAPEAAPAQEGAEAADVVHERTVTFVAEGKEITLEDTEGKTLQQLLEQARITLGEGDVLTLSPELKLDENLTIQVLHGAAEPRPTEPEEPTEPEPTEPETKPAATERTVVSVEVYNDCDDSGHGVKVITYSDGTQEEVYF